MAKGVVALPGSFGTLDGSFELMTPLLTGKLGKKIPIVLYGASFWNEVINFDALARHGDISREDLTLFQRLDIIDEAFDFITSELTKTVTNEPGGRIWRTF